MIVSLPPEALIERGPENPFNGIERWGYPIELVMGLPYANPFNGIERQVLHVRERPAGLHHRIHSMELKEPSQPNRKARCTSGGNPFNGIERVKPLKRSKKARRYHRNPFNGIERYTSQE